MSERLEQLFAELADEIEHAQYDAAREIARTEMPPANRILPWAEDARPQAREMACFLLGAAGTPVTSGAHLYPEGVPTLVRLLEDPNEDVRDWATFGIHQGNHDTPAARARLWKALDDPDPDVRGEAADGLAKFGDRSLIPRLQTLLEDKDVLSACYFLAAEQLGDPVLLPAVLEAAERWGSWGLENDSFIEPTIQVLRDAEEARKMESPE